MLKVVFVVEPMSPWAFLNAICFWDLKQYIGYTDMM